MLIYMDTSEDLLPRVDEMEFIPGAAAQTANLHEAMLEIESHYDTLNVLEDDQAPAYVSLHMEQAIDMTSPHKIIH